MGTMLRNWIFWGDLLPGQFWCLERSSETSPAERARGNSPRALPPPVSHVDCLALCVKAHSSLHMGTPFIHAAARASGTRIASQSLINRDGGVNRSGDRLRIYTMGRSSRNVQNSISSGLQRRYADRDTGIDHIQRDARPSKTQRRESTHLLQMPALGAPPVGSNQVFRPAPGRTLAPCPPPMPGLRQTANQPCNCHWRVISLTKRRHSVADVAPSGANRRWPQCVHGSLHFVAAAHAC